MSVHEPLSQVDLLSEAKQDWLKKPCGSSTFPEMTRFSMTMHIMSITARPTNKRQSILDQAYTGEKLHDREPGLVVSKLEEKIPGFFSNLPRRNVKKSPDSAQKRGLICDFIRHYMHLGLRKYGKPKLRRENGGDVLEID